VADAPREAPAPGFTRRRRLRELGILASVVLCAAVFSALNAGFLTWKTAKTILLNASTDGLMVVGMTIVIVSGCFDLSIGSIMALSGLVSATLMLNGAAVPIAVAAGLLSGVLIGLANGLLVTRLKINPFITTLGTMSVVRGIVLVSTKSGQVTGFPASYGAIAWGQVLGVYLPVLYFLAAVIVADLLLRHHRYLRQVYFIGSNEEAANLTGIDTGRVKRFAFMLMGLLAAASGVIVTAKANALDANEGVGSELRVIAAVIVGGASLSGGKGTILGSFLGLMLMQVITTGLVFQRVPPEAQQIAVGLVLILAAIIDHAGPSLGRTIVSLLTKTRNKKMERAINVVLAAAVVVLLLLRLVPGGRPGAAEAAGAARGSTIVVPKGSSEAALLQRMTARKKQMYVMISGATWGPYWIDSKNGLRDKARELDVEADFEGPPTMDVNAQIDYVKNAIARKVDGIIMVPMADALTPAINEAIDAGIPVVCADADAPSSRRFSFIGTGNFNAGVEGGTRLAELLGGRGEVAIITVTGQDNLLQRVAGYRQALAKYPDIKIVAMGNDQGSPPIAQQQCRAILQAHPNLAGFGCVAAIGGQGAAVAVKEAGRVGQVKIVAMDRDEATLNFIKEGVIQASIAQRTYSMAYIALQLLYNLKNGDIKLINDWKKIGVNPLPPNVDTGSFTISRDNVDFFFRKEADAPLKRP
jgi:ribose/xylose/arabinose/galactoside ABC-type transport system permease subunit/ABC-type sugar transport system substrate-binding protein